MEEKKFTPREALVRFNRQLLTMQSELAQDYGELHDVLIKHKRTNDELSDATTQYFYFLMRYTETYQALIKDLIVKEKLA
jgi:hypothetical protein